MPIRLRRPLREDLPRVTELINSKEVRQGLMPTFAHPLTFDDETAWYEKQAVQNPHEGGNFAIVREVDGLVVGGCAYKEVNWRNSSCGVGIWLGVEHCGQGLGTEALHRLVDFIFAELGLHRAWLKVYSFNGRAIRSYQKVGFVEEARLRERLYRFGRFHDEILMGILRPEWEKSRNTMRPLPFGDITRQEARP